MQSVIVGDIGLFQNPLELVDGEVYGNGFVDVYLLQHLVIIILDFGIVLMHHISKVIHRELLQDVFVVLVDVVNVSIH